LGTEIQLHESPETAHLVYTTSPTEAEEEGTGSLGCTGTVLQVDKCINAMVTINLNNIQQLIPLLLRRIKNHTEEQHTRIMILITEKAYSIWQQSKEVQTIREEEQTYINHVGKVRNNEERHILLLDGNINPLE